LRLLLIRGLIEKITDPKDERAFLYKVTFDLLNILGINKITDFPEFESVNKDIDGFIESQKDNDL
jgi:chromosome segregation and condensation protein ScpB